MADELEGIKNTFSERMRLIRFRRKRESFHFWQEFKLIPRWLVWTYIVLFLIAQVIAQAVLFDMLASGQGEQIFAPQLKDNPALASLALAGIVTLAAIGLAIPIFLAGYVYRDAKRRGMNAGLWTLLVIVLMPGYFVLGFIIYFLMREPLPFNCPQCGATVGARFNFCPNCKYNLHPACPNCKREVGDNDKFCAFCGQDLGAVAASQPSAADQPS
jgi:hypothetical protein